MQGDGNRLHLISTYLGKGNHEKTKLSGDRKIRPFRKEMGKTSTREETKPWEDEWVSARGFGLP